MSKNFEALLDELNAIGNESETLAKAMADAPLEVEDEDEDDTEDDEAIAAAAAAAAAGAGKLKAPAVGDDDGKPVFGKSFGFTDENGTSHEAVDATDLVKSIMDRQEKSDDLLAKALDSLGGVMRKQGDLIKSLSSQVERLSSQGRGRKTMLSVNDKPGIGDTLAKSQAESGVTPEQFFAKANNAFDAGKISGKELNVISVSLRGNHPIEPSLIQKIALA